MKKIITILCCLVQSLIIGLANMYAIALVTNWFADTIGCHGWLNIPALLVVAAMVCTTLAVYMRYLTSGRD